MAENPEKREDNVETSRLTSASESAAVVDGDAKAVLKVEKRFVSSRCGFLLEPVLAAAMIGSTLGYTSLQNFFLRTACSVDLKIPDDVCYTGDLHSVEDQAQSVVSKANIGRSFIGSMIVCTILIFLGPWSDISGRRKPLIIMPLLGLIITTVLILLMLTFPGANTTQVLYAAHIPTSLGGNFGLLSAAAFSYIGDVCQRTGRDVTTTMGSHRAAIQVAKVLGELGGPLLFHCIGFYGVFTTVLLLQVSSLIYTLVVVKDVNVNNDNKMSVPYWRLPVNAVKCLVKPREGNRRKIIFFMLIVALSERVVHSADTLIGYMFYRRKFQWNDVFYGSFLAYKNIMSFFGTIIILSLLKRRLRLSDEYVGMVSGCSYILSAVGLITAPNSYVVLALPIIGILSQGSQVVQRPILKKQIKSSEQGKIYSLMAALQSATQMVTSPLYSFLYFRTVSTLPEAWILPCIGIAAIQIYLYFCTKRLNKLGRDEIEAAPEIVELKEKKLLASDEGSPETNKYIKCGSNVAS